MPWKKWSYMDHWATQTPQGPLTPYFNKKYFEKYIKQLAAAGFTGFDTFFFTLPILSGMYGSLTNFEYRLKELGMEKITGVFTAYPSSTRYAVPHRRETHDWIIADCQNTIRQLEGLSVENFIVMPSCTCFEVEPVTDDKIKAMAELWSKVGAITLEHGMKTTCHFEFWGALRTWEDIDLFFQYSDPETVHFFCDTAQHVIAGVDPVELFRTYRDRCSGFHFKDTHNVDTIEAYHTAPDPELMIDSVPRWFYEMGTDEGLVDFPALVREIVSSGFDGWLTVEHDKADQLGGNYAEATCVAKWYIDNILEQAMTETQENLAGQEVQ